jgi:CRISPR-associated protein Cas2
LNYGQRVQNSGFECVIDASQLKLLKNRLTKLINPKCDSIRFYYLGNNYETKIEHYGSKISYNPEGFLFV